MPGWQIACHENTRRYRPSRRRAVFPQSHPPLAAGGAQGKCGEQAQGCHRTTARSVCRRAQQDIQCRHRPVQPGGGTAAPRYHFAGVCQAIQAGRDGRFWWRGDLPCGKTPGGTIGQLLRHRTRTTATQADAAVYQPFACARILRWPRCPQSHQSVSRHQGFFLPAPGQFLAGSVYRRSGRPGDRLPELFYPAGWLAGQSRHRLCGLE